MAQDVRQHFHAELIEYDDTEKIFTNPGDSRTEQYVTGKFG